MENVVVFVKHLIPIAKNIIINNESRLYLIRKLIFMFHDQLERISVKLRNGKTFFKCSDLEVPNK